MLALGVIRWRNILLGMYFYNFSRQRPDLVRQETLRLVREHLGPDHDVEKHFTPRYNGWGTIPISRVRMRRSPVRFGPTTPTRGATLQATRRAMFQSIVAEPLTGISVCVRWGGQRRVDLGTRGGQCAEEFNSGAVRPRHTSFRSTRRGPPCPVLGPAPILSFHRRGTEAWRVQGR